jgi:hypothetical protein
MGDTNNEAEGRELAQHGGQPGWLKESAPARYDFVRDGRSIPPALTDCNACPGLEQLSCELLEIQLLLLIIYSTECTQNTITSFITQGMHGTEL